MSERKITVARLGAGGVFERAEELDEDTTLGDEHAPDLPPDPAASRGAWVRREGAWRRRCARVDPNGVYLGMVEVAPAELGAHHILTITECDLKPRTAKWVADASPKNPFGGRFEPLPPSLQLKDDGACTDQQLIHALLGALEKHGVELPAEAAPWRAWYEKSMDAVKGAK